MPRLKPPPQRDEIDITKPLEVDLENENEILLNPEEGADDFDREAKAEQAREYRRQKKAEEEARASENNDLKKQLEDMRALMEQQRQAAQDAQRAQEEAIRHAREREREAGHYLSRAEEVEYQSLLTAIGAAESEADGAKRELKNALNNQDNDAAVEAQSRLSRAEAKLIQLEGSKVQLEDRKNQAIERAKRERDNPPVQQQRQQLSVEQQIDGNQALNYAQKEWLKKHQDAWTDPRKNMRLQGAHVEAEDQGLSGQAYFDYLEERLGYKKPTASEEDPEDETQHHSPPASSQRRNTRMAAPVSRDAGNAGRPANKNKVTLTPAQLEAAQISGLTPEAYARQLLRFNDAKEQGYYEQ